LGRGGEGGPAGVEGVELLGEGVDGFLAVHEFRDVGGDGGVQEGRAGLLQLLFGGFDFPLEGFDLPVDRGGAGGFVGGGGRGSPSVRFLPFVRGFPIGPGRRKDEDLRRHLAMKVMLDEQEGAASRLSRFLEEAQVTGQLDHPGIVPVHELGIDARGRVFFTMKLVKGKTLEHVFEAVRHGDDGWSVTRALSVVLRVCEAMAFAHEKGVIHRDLKPANIMVGRFGETYVMDWGLARVLGKKDTKDIGPSRTKASARCAPIAASAREPSPIRHC
jgi:serine/threonine protein kinase